MLATRTSRLFAAMGLAAAILFAPIAGAATRIMPLGDSLTGGPGCWRALLWTNLETSGYTGVDFVGTLPGGGCGVATWDGDNEGHGGYLAINTANQGMLTGWLTTTNPDVVMMTFGTNDVWNARPTAEIVAAFGTLVDQMRRNNSSMRIFVAQIPPVAPPGCSYCQQGTISLNAAIPGWAASKTTAQSPITVVDHWTGWDPVADTTDGVHQSDAGNRKMAAKWFAALTPILGGTSGTAPGAPSGLTATASANGVVTLGWLDNASDETAFAVERKTGATGTWAQVATVAANVTSYQDGGVASGTTYVYRVRASNSYGSSAYSTEASVTTPISSGTGCTCAAGCSSATTITTPFTKDGVGESCWVATSLGSYVNSWNLAALQINGANLTNRWANLSGWPAAINGKYYIYYKSTLPWGHFEAR